jgi:hypothetical protein
MTPESEAAGILGKVDEVSCCALGMPWVAYGGNVMEGRMGSGAGRFPARTLPRYTCLQRIDQQYVRGLEKETYEIPVDMYSC